MENDRLANETAALHEEVTQIRSNLLRERTAVQTQSQEQEQRQVALLQREKDSALQMENLTALKDTLDPKLKEITALQEQAEADRHQAELLRDAPTKHQADLDQQRSDLATLSSQLHAKAEALTEYDAALKRTAAELQIRLQQAKSQGITVSTPVAP